MTIQIAAGDRLRGLKRLLQFLRPFKWTLIFALVILALRILLEVTSVYFLSPVITTITHGFKMANASHDLRFWDWILGSDASALRLRSSLMWMGLSQLGLAMMVYFRAFWDAKLSSSLIANMRESIYDHLQYLEFSFYDQMTSGKLLSRALGDLDTVHSFVNLSLFAAFDIVFSIGAYLCLLGWQSPTLLATALLPLPLWLGIIIHFSKKSAPLFLAQRQAMDCLVAAVSENVAGRHVVRASGAEAFENEKFREKNRILFERILAGVRFQATLNPSLQSMAISIHILTFIVCSFLIQKALLPIGDLLILGTAMGTILGRLQNINSIAETFQRALVSGERLFEILDAEIQPGFQIPNQGETGSTLENPEGDLCLEDVCFAYQPDRPVLNHVSCQVRYGTITALIGPTGSGKTTLSALVARFYSPETGRITIGGQDIREISLHELRRHIGFVFQETFLFSASIRDNIRYGRLDVQEEMLIAAARAAHAHEFIVLLPQGYDTRIGEGGIQLSGGQRQRLSLARALVYAPEILILDDATAALDASTEALIRQSLIELRKYHTILMITHSQASLALADSVIVMKNGRVVDTNNSLPALVAAEFVS